MNGGGLVTLGGECLVTLSGCGMFMLGRGDLVTLSDGEVMKPRMPFSSLG